jgi:trehalose 6-phosphate phosphatase
MRGLLAQSKVLETLAHSKTLLAFDFDGTLSPIVRDRDAAGLRARTSALFHTVCELYPTAVISGRARRDVAARLGNARVDFVVGNHGLEPGTDLAQARRVLDPARKQFSALSALAAGVELEDKRYSLAVHYRRARNRAAAQRAIRQVIASLQTPMRIIDGKCVLNVVPANAPNKGDALLKLRRKAKAEIALYVGDDVTDEDVFRIEQPSQLITARIGKSSSSAASYYLRNQREVDALLARLISLRS